MTFSRRDLRAPLARSPQGAYYRDPAGRPPHPIRWTHNGLPGDDACVLAFAHAYERRSRRFLAPGQV